MASQVVPPLEATNASTLTRLAIPWVSETLMIDFPLIGGVTTIELLMGNHPAYVNLQPKTSTLLQRGFGLCDI